MRHRFPSTTRRVSTPARSVLAAIALFCWPAVVVAGGGPEGVLLVVNPQSPSSLTIANHYAQLRAIPLDNLLYLPWPPNLQTTDIDTFRQRILFPMLVAMRNRGLADHIDYVVYSSDFPWGIALDSDIRKFLESARRSGPPPGGSAEGKPPGENAAGQLQWPKHLTPVGAINGLTYLWQAVAAGSPAYFEFQSNHYLRLPSLEQRSVSSAGFRGTREYGAHGEVVASGGRRYFLSMMLGVTAAGGQLAGRSDRVSQAERRGRRNAPEGNDLFRPERRCSLESPRRALSHRRRRVDEAGSGRPSPRRHGAAEQGRRAGRGDGHGHVRLEGLRQHHSARGHLRQLHQFRRRDQRGPRPNPALRVPPLRRGRRQRHRDRAVCHRRQVPLAPGPGPLRPRLHLGRGVLSVGP